MTNNLPKDKIINFLFYFIFFTVSNLLIPYYFFLKRLWKEKIVLALFP